MSGNSIILIEIFTDMQLEQVSTAINYPTLPWVNQFKCYAVPFSFSYIYIYIWFRTAVIWQFKHPAQVLIMCWGRERKRWDINIHNNTKAISLSSTAKFISCSSWVIELLFQNIFNPRWSITSTKLHNTNIKTITSRTIKKKHGIFVIAIYTKIGYKPLL